MIEPGQIRQDRFQAGDKVVWADEDAATLTNGRKRLGDGPFEVTGIIDATRNVRAVGHTQWVVINRRHQFSGAFFVKAQS